MLDGEVRVQAKFYVPTHFGEWSQQVNSAGDRMLKTSAEEQTKIRLLNLTLVWQALSKFAQGLTRIRLWETSIRKVAN